MGFLTDTTMSSLVDMVSILLLGTVLFSVLVRRFITSVRLLIVQGLLLTGVAAIMAASTGTVHSFIAIGVTFAIKAVVVPGALLFTLNELKVKREVEMVVSRKTALVAAIGLVLVSRYAVGSVSEFDAFLGSYGLPIAVSMLLIGFLNMLIRKKALSEIIGIVAMENGLYLMALVGTHGLPLAVELGVAVDLVVAVLIMVLVTRQIQRSFDTTNTDYLTILRG